MVTVKEQKEKDKSRRESLGKYLYNLSQTCFTAMVIGATVSFFLTDVPLSAFIELLIMGVVSTLIFATMANDVLKK
ncbi:MAG: hypothetical protein ACI4T9_09535 [Prevotella sp.]|jgi:hypothetical protein